MSSSTGRTLTLTEELERLEQSITLTLQEIDHNFSKAHRIVTTSILPLVEQYGEHSKSVWEASKFWKQFFEASANVSLSGYEELAEEEEEEEEEEEDETTAAETTLDETTSDYGTAQDEDATVEQPGYREQQPQRQQQQQRQPRGDVEDSLLVDTEMSGSTPRPPASKSLKPQVFAEFESPYEKLRRQLKGKNGGGAGGGEPIGGGDDDETETMELPAHATATATAAARLLDATTTQRSSSLLLDEPTLRGVVGGRQLQLKLQQSAAAQQHKTKDPLLHRVLDKNYRIQATPHKGAPPPIRGLSPDKGARAAEDPDRTRRLLWADSPMSSPEMAVPKLRSDLYHMSPAKARGGRRARAPAGPGPGNDGPRTPGVSVQTPTTARKTRDALAYEHDDDGDDDDDDGGGGGNDDYDRGKGKKGKGKADEIKWESDSEDDTAGVFGGMSPPKTIQFALPPSKLMRTPAREASKRIVEDILLTAGAAPDEESEYSPTMVKMNQDILDDTF